MMTEYKEILNALPYKDPFLFVDELSMLTEHKAEGTYRFKENEYFYEGHFKNDPVTPGVILVECMAQIGLVAMGLFLVGLQGENQKIQLAFSAADVQFLEKVLPGDQVRVKAERGFWRMGKLSVNAQMFNAEGKLVCKGTLSGMIKQRK